MRQNLIFHLHCSECGSILNMRTYNEKRTEPHDLIIDGEPTGAACNYSRISVEPCRQCIEKHTRPAKQLSSAIEALSKLRN